ncbi:hypothetical protein [Bradyrhizobium erythrophlei]|uniref:hypothetical protein n=1 Tax=Bradyrhizobium erythrophlei TaxID=1437360 RepID=UPI001FCE199E|nr:hypothetical protein [Bradyrhizobium erythrophlei]
MEFPFAGVADVRTDHKSIDVLGIDPLGKTASGLQKKAERRCPAGSSWIDCYVEDHQRV